MPSRVVHLEEARRRYGDLIDRLVPWLSVQDPPADAVVDELQGRYDLVFDALQRPPTSRTPASVRNLIDAHATVPVWVDLDRANRGGRLFFRTGLAGALVLGARSLTQGYSSPAGNKPLAMTGTFKHSGPRRLAETGKYVAAVCRPNGLMPYQEGWQISLRVRLMHAHVRSLLLQSDGWRSDAWGAPINQHDLLATSMLFSFVFVDGVRQLGVQVSRAESEDHLHLWRWASWLMGVQLELLPDTEAQAKSVTEVIRLTQGPPDEDARRLVRQLLSRPGHADGPLGRSNLGRHLPPSLAPERVAAQLAEGLCYGLLPRETAEGLGLPRTPWRHAVSLARVAITPTELARRVSPWVEESLVRFGEQHWQRAVRQGLRGGKPTYTPPPTLAGRL